MPALNIPIKVNLDDFKKGMSEASSSVSSAAEFIAKEFVKMNISAAKVIAPPALAAIGAALPPLISAFGPMIARLVAFKAGIDLVSAAVSGARAELNGGHLRGFADGGLASNVPSMPSTTQIGATITHIGAGATSDGRLHLHGAIQTSKADAPTHRAALVAIGGNWPESKHPEYQLDFQPMTDADGWVRYVLKQGPSARRLIITGKSLTIPKELRREGHRRYDALRAA